VSLTDAAGSGVVMHEGEFRRGLSGVVAALERFAGDVTATTLAVTAANHQPRGSTCRLSSPRGEHKPSRYRRGRRKASSRVSGSKRDTPAKLVKTPRSSSGRLSSKPRPEL
jgi:hypothetical protein